jgi:molybdate/tungstate transport system substrate-binding protein
MLVAVLAAAALSACASSAPTGAGAAAATATPTVSRGPVAGTLVINGAGTLAVPFTAVIDAFKREHPEVTVASRFAGSVELVRGVTQLKEPVDVLGVADASLIPAQMFGADGTERFADWAIGFASNQITLAYTDRSAGAAEVTPTNWYQVLARPGVQIGRSNPDTDPSGYQVLQMLALAQDYYHEPTLSASVLANSPTGTLVNTETSLLPALQAGQIDYLAVYRSDALQHHLHFLDLPAQINLADPTMAARYATVRVTTASGVRTGKPIVYGLTIPTDAPNPTAAQAFLAFVLGPTGRQIMHDNGFVTITPATVTGGAVPPALGALTTPQPSPPPSPR